MQVHVKHLSKKYNLEPIKQALLSGEEVKLADIQAFLRKQGLKANVTMNSDTLMNIINNLDLPLYETGNNGLAMLTAKRMDEYEQQQKVNRLWEEIKKNGRA